MLDEIPFFPKVQMYIRFFIFLYFFFLPLKPCLHVDAIVQYVWAGIYSMVVFCPVFLHTHTSGSYS